MSGQTCCVTQTPANVALEGCRVWRPAGLGEAVELVAARPANRTFPLRMTDSLGICLKTGPAHDVQVNGRWVAYPADAICVRPPGCVWRCAATGVAGFVSIDVEGAALPRGIAQRSMTFLPGDQIPELSRAV